MSQWLSFRIVGLDCADEVAVLKRELAGLADGPDNIQFDVLDGKMSILPAEGVGQEDVARAVAGTGMKALPWAQPSPARQPFWREHGKAILAAVSAAFLAAGFVAHWIVHGSFMDALAGGYSDGHVNPPAVAALYLLSAFAGVWYVAPKAWLALRRLRPDMNLLMSIAILGAFLIGDWFEAASVAFLFAAANLLEHWSVGRARRAIGALMQATPATARVVSGAAGQTEVLPIEQIAIGRLVLVRPGEKIPLDGQVTGGRSSVNQAPITGESMPVGKAIGDEVFAGSINGDGALEFRVTKPPGDTTLARMIRLVQHAQAHKAPAQQWVDRFALYYTPMMMILATAIAVVPPLIGSGGWAAWFYRALVILVISCPCALVISTPVAIISALARSAREGVLIKGGLHLETAGRIATLAIDKTGTLTFGKMEVQRVVGLAGHSEDDVLGRAASLESHSEHPLGKAILSAAADRGLELEAARDFQAIKGKGAVGVIGQRQYWIGSHRLMHEMGQETPEVHDAAEAMEDAGHSVVAIGNDRHVCGLIAVADGVRPQARGAIAELRRLGVRRVVMLSGDNRRTAAAVAAAVGVDEFHAEQLPEDKLATVQQLAGNSGAVAMVGDGINDAPAMAAADLGIAMAAAGTDAAIETADVALMSDDLSHLPWLIRHSRATLGIIRQNIAVSLAIKAVFICLAVANLATLWSAIAADMGGSLLVTFNALRLLRGRRGDAGTRRRGDQEAEPML